MQNTISYSEGRRTLAKNKRSGTIVLLMEAIEGGSKVSWNHLDVASAVQRSAGHTVEAHTDRGGSRYVLEVSDPADAEKLKQITELSGGFKVRVGAHPTLNKIRCVISSVDIINESEQILKEHFATQGVVDVHRICKGSGEGKVNTSSVVLTFEGTSFPETVKFGLLSIRTRAYYALPLQCYNCYGYGHGRAGCKNKTRCRVCSGVHPVAEKCGAKAFCSNCRGNHQPTNRRCPTYVKEADILRIKTNLGVSFGDAKKVYSDERSGKSYAAVAAGTAPVDSGKGQQVPLFSSQGKKKKKAKQGAAKSNPKGKGTDGAPSAKGAKAGKKGTTQCKSTGVGASPPAGLTQVASATKSGKATGREGKVLTQEVGTDPLPDAETPTDKDKQLLEKLVESLRKEVALGKGKIKQLKESKTRLEMECASLVGQLERVGVNLDSSESEVTAPVTRRKRKQTAGLEDTRGKKSRKKGENSAPSPPIDSVSERESDAVAGKK